jgi:hypothetical protein
MIWQERKAKYVSQERFFGAWLSGDTRYNAENVVHRAS